MARSAKPSSLSSELVDPRYVFIILSFEKERSALGTVTGNTVNKMHMQLPGLESKTESQNYSLI